MKSKFIPPTLAEVEAYIKDEGYYDVNPEKFWSYYENRMWGTGKPTKQFPYGRPMVCWKLAVKLQTKTTKEKRLMHKTKTCACGCGRKPMLLVDGKCYAMEKCIAKANKNLFQEPEIIQNNSTKPLTNKSVSDIISANIFKAPEEPKRRPMYQQVNEILQAKRPVLTSGQVAEQKLRIQKQLQELKQW